MALAIVLTIAFAMGNIVFFRIMDRKDILEEEEYYENLKNQKTNEETTTRFVP